MSNTPAAGPALHFQRAGASDIPLYLISFDKEGSCLATRTLQNALAAAASGSYTDVHIYAHGWNNVYQEALAHYQEFFSEYFELRSQAGFDDHAYTPMIIGIIWPSTVLLTKDEATPDLLGSDPAASSDQAAIGEIAAALPGQHASRFIELASRRQPLSHAESVELATLLAPIVQLEERDGEGLAAHATAQELVQSWGQPDEKAAATLGEPAAMPDEPDEPDGRANASTPASAGNVSFLNPREIVRKASVYLMKDRAGTVGANGVAAMLSALLENGRVRVHLAGHSYGAKVVLSALAMQDPEHKVASVLLLQAAINKYCFAKSIAEHDGLPGGYRGVLDRTSTPILATFSKNDSALTTFYPIALRRNVDVGDTRIAGDLHSFDALGGFGPDGMAPGESKVIKMLARPEQYALSDQGVRVYALDGSDDAIHDHGDVRNAYTEWALANLVNHGAMQ